MRLFAAIALDERVRLAAHDVGVRLARALAPRGGRGRSSVSWVRAENLHLTLRFLGEVEARRVEELTAQFGTPVAMKTFEIELGGIGVFPPSGPPRVVWLGVSRGAERLAGLSEEVERRFVAWGFGPADRPFQAHLTLGRCRDSLGPQAREQFAAAAAGVIGTSRVDHVALYESRLSPSGPTYVELARAPLAG